MARLGNTAALPLADFFVMDEPDHRSQDTSPWRTKCRRVAVYECYCSGGGGTTHLHCFCAACRRKAVHQITEYRHFLREWKYNDSLRSLRGLPSTGSDSCHVDDDVVDKHVEELEHSSVCAESDGDGAPASTENGGETSTLTR